jgi:hypothetical protein
MGHARKERVLVFGTDQRITSGPAAKRPHSKAGYMAAPERFAESQIPLAPRAPSIHGPLRPKAKAGACPQLAEHGRAGAAPHLTSVRNRSKFRPPRSSVVHSDPNSLICWQLPVKSSRRLLDILNPPTRGILFPDVPVGGACPEETEKSSSGLVCLDRDHRNSSGFRICNRIRQQFLC